MSNVIFLTEARRSSASPSLTRKPCFVAFPIAAMIAVGVARTSAHGQKTTRIVTARMISPEISQVRAAAVRAITTIHVAQRSARPTILAFPASADCTRRIILWIELSSPTLDAFISKAPNWFTVPDETSSPTVLSTGSDSPVMTAWFTEVCPDVITPSTGTVSPGSTRKISPTFTCSAGMVFSPFIPIGVYVIYGCYYTYRGICYQ